MTEVFLYTFMPVAKCWYVVREEYLRARIFQLTFEGMFRAGHKVV